MISPTFKTNSNTLRGKGTTSSSISPSTNSKNAPLVHALDHFETKKAAADHLGIPVRSLYNKIKRFELE